MSSTNPRILEKLGTIVTQIPTQINDDSQADPVVDVSVITIQLGGDVTVMRLDSPDDSPFATELAMMKALLSTVSTNEPSPRVRTLLTKALKQVEFAYRIKTGEVRSTLVH
ncbi:hypothetical protein F6X40_17355 [Paraburkholderia sp. UCT31]|uniref:hypothetical protein n=1 Tax=Paraburkholderia sp. UCT31 TaxID=2615209 RepID=UPI00165646EA|nr:hypothetical protein [Paraburkholderia sp. UCT31]MBC8738529.1 hypothetical protein [Paraburkholderia sp. UCT31]